MGLPSENFIAWTKNGIEHLYPTQIMETIFRCSAREVAQLTIEADLVSLNGIEKRKKELCQEVVRAIDSNTNLPSELEEKLIHKIVNAIQ